MKNLAPKITRQRLIIEGFFEIDVSRKVMLQFFNGVTKSLSLRKYGKPIIYATGSKGKKINQGFDAFVPLVDSGISLYIWRNVKFFSAIVYSCKKFNVKKAVNFTKKFFKTRKIAYRSF